MSFMQSVNPLSDYARIPDGPPTEDVEVQMDTAAKTHHLDIAVALQDIAAPTLHSVLEPGKNDTQ